MKQQIERLRGGVAFGMMGIGPKPVMSPPDETGNDGGSDDGNNAGGDNGGNQGGDSGNGDGGDKAGASRTSKLGGLFGQRGQAGAGGSAEESGSDAQGSDAQPGADGRPAGLAEKFWDAEKKAIRIDALTASYKELERAHGELKRQKGQVGGEVPEDASGYFSEGITVPETADRFSGLSADDPGVKAFADVCKARGIGKDLAAGIMSDMLVAMNQHQPAPIDMDQEMKSLGNGGPALVDGLFVWAEGLEAAGQLSGADIDVIERIGQTADGIRFLAKLRNMTGEQPIPVDPGGGVQGMSLDQLDAKYKAAVKAGDYAEQERLDALRAKINPEGQAPGISGRQGGYSI